MSYYSYKASCAVLRKWWSQGVKDMVSTHISRMNKFEIVFHMIRFTYLVLYM